MLKKIVNVVPETMPALPQRTAPPARPERLVIDRRPDAATVR
jgi:hypothetical protein